MEFLLEAFQDYGQREALIWNEERYSYHWLLERIGFWEGEIEAKGITPGDVVSLEADFSPQAVSLLFSLINKSCIIVPLCNEVKVATEKLRSIASPKFEISIDQEDRVSIRRVEAGNHEYYEELRKRKHPGLVLFTSGTSGEPKGAVHDFTLLLEKFKGKRDPYRTINFLLFDHWGGLNTMFHTLSNGGTVISVRERSPHEVCRIIEKEKVELLPTSPTFLNLLLISEAYRDFDLESLKVITYGTEPMPEGTLKALGKVFPSVRLHQTYGLIEVGVLRSKSRSQDSLWVKVGGEGYETRVVDGILQIKASSAMLGYLNAPSPYTEDGWFDTGDSVEVDGDYIRILGRKSEIINVGGEKVYPAEVEGVIKEISSVADVTVYGEKNPIMGNIVCADVSLVGDYDSKEFSSELKKHCRQMLQGYKVPVKVNILDEIAYSDRFKKVRKREGEASPSTD